MFVRRIDEPMEVGNRTTNAVQLPIDKHTHRPGPAPHDLVQRQIIEFPIMHHSFSFHLAG